MSTDTIPRSFDLGRVFSNTFQAIGRNFGVFAILAFLFGVLPQAAFGAFTVNTMGSMGDGSDPSQIMKQLPLFYAGIAVSVLFTCILQGAIVHGAVDSFNGKKASLAASLSTGLRNFLPLLGIAILSSLGIMLGLILLIVPGIILALMWTVASPVKVVEKVGVIESFSRSIKLTDGSRLWILLVVVIYAVASWIVGAIASAVGLALSLGLGGEVGSIAVAWPLQVVISPLIAGLGAMVSTTGLAAIYFELRQIKEGVGPDSLASVFD